MKMNLVQALVTYLVVPLGLEVQDCLGSQFHQERGVQVVHELQVSQEYQIHLDKDREVSTSQTPGGLIWFVCIFSIILSCIIMTRKTRKKHTSAFWVLPFCPGPPSNPDRPG